MSCVGCDIAPDRCEAIQCHKKNSDFPSSEFILKPQTCVCAPRRDAPEGLPLIAPLKVEGVGNAGCPLHPQPRVQKKSTRVVATGPPESPGIPARDGFNGLYRALLGDEFLFVTVIGELTVSRSPVEPARPPPT
jgi:hypothetical protein